MDNNKMTILGFLIGCGFGCLLVSMLGEIDFQSFVMAMLILILIGVIYIIAKK